MDLVTGRGSFDRERGHFPPWSQVNMLLEPSRTDAKGYNLLSIPPLVEIANWGSDPVYGAFQKPGVFGGDRFAVIGDQLYREGVSVGTLTGIGTGVVRWASLSAEIVLTRGNTAYSYIEGNLAAVAFPDGAPVAAVHSMARLFVYVRNDVSGRFYWSSLNDGRTIDALDFANPESEPDATLDVFKTGDVFWFFGGSSGEAWVLSGDTNLPWNPVSQQKVDKGIRATGCGQEIAGTVYWVADDNSVRALANASATRVSDPALDEKIKASTACLAFRFAYEGKEIFCVKLDDATYGLDVGLDNQPVEFQTYGRASWAPNCAANNSGEPLFGDDATGTLWGFGSFGEGATDAGNETMVRLFSAGMPLNTKPQPVSNVLVDGNAGDTTATSGEAADPILEMRISRDGGRTYSEWRATKWGALGEYKRQARFGSCGYHGPPGFLAQFRMVQVAPLRVANVRVNESLAGRGR